MKAPLALPTLGPWWNSQPWNRPSALAPAGTVGAFQLTLMGEGVGLVMLLASCAFVVVPKFRRGKRSAAGPVPVMLERCDGRSTSLGGIGTL